MNGVKSTEFNLPGQTKKYAGKVRDVYFVSGKMVMVASDRISAFDHILPEAIPYKGQILNTIAYKNLKFTEDIITNWSEEMIDPMVTACKVCEPYAVEMVIRGYLTGHAWREYRDGKRSLCGVPLPEGLKEHDKLPEPIITPTTKAAEGHDEDISREEIIAQGLVKEDEYLQLEEYTRKLFERGTEIAAKQDLILVDTKYEFGKYDDTIILIDEIHTPDSSRYFYKDTYEQNQKDGIQQKQLSKEFVRQWLISNGFQGKEGQEIPTMDAKTLEMISGRYIELYEKFMGEKFEKTIDNDPKNRIEKNILNYLTKI